MPDLPAILVVDDDDAVLRAVLRLLRGGGYQVETASSTEQALEKLARQRFGAAVVDLHLGGRRSGVSLVTAMRSEGDRTPVIGYSGAPPTDPSVALMRRECAAFLLKPFRASDLFAAIEKATGGHGEAQAAVAT